MYYHVFPCATMYSQMVEGMCYMCYTCYHVSHVLHVLQLVQYVTCVTMYYMCYNASQIVAAMCYHVLQCVAMCYHMSATI